MALPAIPILLAGARSLFASGGIKAVLRGGAATALKASRRPGASGIAQRGLALLGKGLSAFAKMSPLNQLFVAGMGAQGTYSIARQSQLNAQVRRYGSPGGW